MTEEEVSVQLEGAPMVLSQLDAAVALTHALAVGEAGERGPYR